MVRVGVFSVSGYAGQKLVEILLLHPSVRVTYGVVAPNEGTPTVAEIIPRAAKLIDLRCDNAPDWERIGRETDLVFLALPHIVSMSFVPELLKRGKKVVDLSADFRFSDADVYAEHYTRHACPELLAEAVYGLPEMNREKIRRARLLANPGCYPTSVALGLLPLASAGLVEERVIADSKSGVTGAGRAPSVATMYAECNESLRAYKIGEHRHAPEMDEVLSSAGGRRHSVLFVPHLVPINQGILSTVYATLSADVPAEEIQRRYEEFYAKEPFVRVMRYGESPAIKNVVGTNFCDIGVKLTGGRQLVAVSTIDNLIKGAAGQAVQNMNLMCGFPEQTPFYQPA